MKLLLLCTVGDTDFLDRFQRLPTLVGHKLLKTTTPYINPVTLDAVCNQQGVDAVVCCQQVALEAILQDTPDFIPPKGNKQIKLRDYAGSLLRLRSGREVVIITPLERLQTVPWEKFVTNRFISKLTKPESWWKQTAFTWAPVTLDNRETVLSRIAAARLVAIDIETPWPADEIRSIDCVSYVAYFPDTHTTECYVVPFNEPWHWSFIKAANSTSTPKVLQHGLFDNAYFIRWNLPVRNWLWDTLHLFHSWYSELPKRLDFVAAFSLRDVRYWKDDGSTGNLADRHRYCARDGWATVNSLLSLMGEAPLWALNNYTFHEFPMVFPSLCAAMEGLDADETRFLEIKAKKETELAALLARLQYLVAAPGYNPGSWQQNEQLFKVLGVGNLGGTGKIPTLKAKAAHPLNNMLLALVEGYKQEAKQVGTYFAPEKLWNGRIYYNFHPGGTDTGRAASSESSFDCGWQIQNIPARDDSFKQCVLAPPGWYIGEVDKKQSEARCVGYLSGDEALIALVESPHDYHSWNAQAFFGVPYPEIYNEEKGKTLNKPLRDLSKRTNHGANYNMGAGVMLDTMGPKIVAEAKILLKLPARLTLKQVCQFLLDRYATTYPRVKKDWYEHIMQTIETTKRLVSAFGWTRYFFGSPRNNKQHLNEAVAHAPQNLSVAIVNREWYKIWRETIYGELRGKVRIKAQIHDSLLFIYRELADAQRVMELMDTRIVVEDAHGVSREMFIPSDLSTGDQPSRRWSEIK